MSEEIAWEKTPKGEDFHGIISLFLTEKGNVRRKISPRTMNLIWERAIQFQKRWHLNAFDLIEKVFGKK